ncbi:MAG: AAA family ATPase, partial [Actinomycetota bacterium]|nr:AAA family ATPase [Actinomycetota bacterium]
ALAGRGRAVVLHGEPGIGKTHLAREAARRAAAKGAAVGYGGAVEGDVTPAYWPWTHALRQLLEGFDRGVVPDAVRRALAELATLDPALAEWAGGVTVPVPPAEPDLARARLQHAAVDAVVGLSSLGPVAVVLEDVQWADQSSLQLLALLGPELDRVPVLVVVTHRDEETAPASTAALGALARLGGTVDIALGGLAPPAVHHFVEVTAGQEISEEVAHAIAARTSGNPQFVVELTRLLRSERGLTEDGVRHAPVPAGVREVVRRRLDRLPPQTTTVLTVAAAIGRRFDLALLERVAQVPEDELLDRVESAVAIGLVVEDAGTVGTFSFAHDLVRDVLRDAVGGTRRVRLHARIARALLEAAAEPPRPFDVAHHLVQAVPVVPAEEVVPHVLAAADAAVNRLAFEQAEEQLRRAVTLLDLLPPEARAAHELAVRVRLGRVLTFIHGHASAEVGEHIGRAVELAEAVDPRPEVIQALWAVAVFAGVAGQFARTLAVSRKLLAWGEEHGNAAAVCLGHTALGGFAWCLGDLETASHHSDLAVAVADANDLDPTLVYDPELAAGVSARANQSLAAWLAGRDEESRALMADAIRRAEGSGKESALVFAWCFDAWLGVLRQDLAHARRRAGEAIDRADAIGYRQFSLIGRMFAAAAIDDPDARASELHQLVKGWEATGARLYLTCFLALHADAELTRDRVERAAELLARALDVVEDTGERFYEPEIHRLLGVVAERQGRREAARSHYTRACDVAKELGLVALGDRLGAT